MERRRVIQGGLAAMLGFAAFEDMRSDAITSLIFGPTPPSTGPYLVEPSAVEAAKADKEAALHTIQTAIANGEDPKVASTLVDQNKLKEANKLIAADPLTNAQSKAKQYRQRVNEGVLGGYTSTPSQDEMDGIKLIAKEEQRQATFELKKTRQALVDFAISAASVVLARAAIR